MAPVGDRNERKHYMRFKRLASVVGATLLVGGVATTAYATSTANPTVVSNTAPRSFITVTSTGLNTAGGFQANYQQCWRSDAVATFNQVDDCSAFTADVANIQPGTGNATKSFEVFNGDEPNFGEWGCGPLSTAANTQQTCWIRITPNDTTNTTNDEFVSFTFGPVVDPVIPEVPLNILLPASAAAILGAGFLIARKRSSHMAA
jgi:hypothetical protein